MSKMCFLKLVLNFILKLLTKIKKIKQMINKTKINSDWVSNPQTFGLTKKYGGVTLCTTTRPHSLIEYGYGPVT